MNISPIGIENTRQLTELMSKQGTSIVITAWGILVFTAILLILLNRVLNPKTDKDVIKTLIDLNTTMRGFSSKMEEFSNTMAMNNKVFDRLEHVEAKAKNFEMASKKNLIQFIRLIFRKYEICQSCVDNATHDKLLCPYPDNVLCETVEQFKSTLMYEINLYITDDSVKSKIENCINTYVQPDKAIKQYFQEMLKELELIIK